MNVLTNLHQVRNNKGKSLKGGLSGYRSIRAVGQRYRIVYKIERERVIVYIIGIGIRKEGGKGDVYAQLKKNAGENSIGFATL